MKRTFSYRNISALACALLVATTAFSKPMPKDYTKQSKKNRERVLSVQQPQKRGTINKLLHLVSAGGMALVIKHLFESGKDHYLNPRNDILDSKGKVLKRPSNGVPQMCAIMGTACVLATYFLIKDAFFEKQPVRQDTKHKKKKPVAEQVSEAAIDTEAVVEVSEPTDTEQTKETIEVAFDNSDLELFLDAIKEEEKNLIITDKSTAQEQNSESQIKFEVKPAEQENTTKIDGKLDSEETELNSEENQSFDSPELTEDTLEKDTTDKDVIDIVDNTQEEEIAPIEQSESPEVEADTSSEIVNEYVKIEQEVQNLNEQFEAMLQEA